MPLPRLAGKGGIIWPKAALRLDHPSACHSIVFLTVRDIDMSSWDPPETRTDTSHPVAAAQDHAMPEGPVDGDEAEWEEYDPHDALIEPSVLRRLLYGFGSCGISMVVHLVGLILAAFLTLPSQTRDLKTLVEAVFEERAEDDPVEFELDDRIEAVTEQTMALASASPMVGVAVGVQGVVGTPQLDQEILQKAVAESEMGEISIDPPLAGAPSFDRLVEAVPEGEFKGEPRAIIEDYQQAMDRIAQELMWMMDKGPVLVIWAFDQSGSMKDDQQEIRERINNVYVQLGLVGRDKSQWLTTSVVSYGQGYQMHTRRPTSDIDLIRSAIDQVPEDASGKEIMCQAVGRAIAQHRDYVRTSKRQMALILVTDESGEPDDNAQYLERAIAEAKAAKCRIYVLGRESVFGYPYVHMRWQHPQTGHIHWLPVNRGPETGFVEQLQTNGFRRRHDAFPSGFGPYEQCRMARETGGIFFMLPSLESALVRGEKRDYELEIMRPYRADLRARVEVLADRERYPLRTAIWNVIYDLNPYRKEVAQQIEMRMHFSPAFNEFVRQARIEQAKAQKYLTYLATVQRQLEAGSRYREEEADPRWQANYDLIYAQLIAYQARIWEYGASLEAFIQNPKVVPTLKPPDRRLVHWDVITRGSTLTEESKPYIDRSRELFQKVIDNHPGTPWAARADAEMRRGFGVDFRPEYRRPYNPAPGGSAPIPIPKL
jgi:hypothetical protein